MGTTFLLLSEQGLQCLTIKKSKKHIKFLEKSTYPWLPAFIAAYTSSYNKFLMPFADKRSNGMSDWNKYKSQFVSLQKDSWSRPLQKIFTFRKCHCKYTAKFICLNHDASQPHPKCHLGNTFKHYTAQTDQHNHLPWNSKGPHVKVNPVMLLKGMWNTLTLDRVHRASFRAQNTPLVPLQAEGDCVRMLLLSC